MLLVEALQKFVHDRTFPSDNDFVALFSSDGARFIDQEDLNWDFKDQWPFSYSGEYFLSIARLIAAFANTFGGMIIFGVHDEKRTGSHNKVLVNTDKMRQSIAGTMNACPEFEVRHYDLPALGEIDCLLVPARKQSDKPYRFVKPNKYGAAIWVRDGRSVVKAEPKHFPLLYCRVSESQDDLAQPLPGSIPTSPRKLDRFIGRMEAMEYLFEWLSLSDEPLTYLWGRGEVVPGVWTVWRRC